MRKMIAQVVALGAHAGKYDGGMCVRMLDLVKVIAESTKHKL